MSALIESVGWVGPEEYLAGERNSEIRHEYLDGRVYATPGAGVNHNRIARNILAELTNALRGKKCEPFGSDMKVKIPPTFADAYYYPDVTVACDPSESAEYYREHPSVIFEVLSPDTERTDRREKALAYRHIPTLEFYVLVEQERMAITVMRRAEPGWVSEIIEGPGATLKLSNIGVEIPLARIYERTTLLSRS
jgi:Uma2 family endonuclease